MFRESGLPRFNFRRLQEFWGGWFCLAIYTASMAKKIDALTEKEKATLRLIVSGHDAKSSARELGLSVHTINERLRSARRKLEVTSSREAARLLMKRETDKNAAYKDFGDASASNASDVPLHQQPARNRVKWIGGILIMLSLALITSLAFADFSGQDRQVGDPATAIENVQLKEFESSARQWLALVDASDWSASFAAAGASFQELNTVATWQEVSQQARAPLGNVIDRKTDTAEFVNAPPHGYVVMRFQSSFENCVEATEVVTLESEAGVWKVVGYVIE